MCRNMLNYDNVGRETAWALVRRNNSNNSLRWESAPFKQKEIKEKKKRGLGLVFYATFSGESE